MNKCGPKGGPIRGDPQRFPYEPRLVEGKWMMPAELQQIHRLVLDTPPFGYSRMRCTVVECLWPELVSKLRPK
jgi:hypothetical protein